MSINIPTDRLSWNVHLHDNGFATRGAVEVALAVGIFVFVCALSSQALMSHPPTKQSSQDAVPRLTRPNWLQRDAQYTTELD